MEGYFTCINTFCKMSFSNTLHSLVNTLSLKQKQPDSSASDINCGILEDMYSSDVLYPLVHVSAILFCVEYIENKKVPYQYESCLKK